MLVSQLSKFFDDELKSNLKNVMITRDQNGVYTLFGKYSIVPNKNGYFKVRSFNLSVEFATLKNALAFVTLHHAGKYREAGQIETLDLRLCSVNLDLAVHRNILKKKTDFDTRLTYIIKIQEDTLKKRRIIEEIKSYINSSIRIQNRKFRELDAPNFI